MTLTEFTDMGDLRIGLTMVPLRRNSSQSVFGTGLDSCLQAEDFLRKVGVVQADCGEYFLQWRFCVPFISMSCCRISTSPDPDISPSQLGKTTHDSNTNIAMPTPKDKTEIQRSGENDDAKVAHSCPPYHLVCPDFRYIHACVMTFEQRTTPVFTDKSS